MPEDTAARVSDNRKKQKIEPKRKIEETKRKGMGRKESTAKRHRPHFLQTMDENKEKSGGNAPAMRYFCYLCP
ncbi:ComG operon protein 2-like protein [Prevotella dentalis DSM 3688]|uniref:ComG operon protein 2-like protein n=1 Tax=Prevotella dentalis (strain ATCC 49559 / DSM 3688 / JCM 13448 / NCTC 12043 / ES 2772) TaxID=908937 RepID=F9D3D4_PREDD|nr:ComG operon protein 2-like protein [Prevotella dentalis DSM 3688]